MNPINEVGEMVEKLKPMVEALEKFDMSRNMNLLEGFLHIKDAISILSLVKEVQAKE